MGLKHLKLRVETVEVSDDDMFTVRGLDLADIIAIVEPYKDRLAPLFAEVMGNGVEGVIGDTSSIMLTLARVVPEVVRDIIAIGAEEDDTDLVKLLPFPVQLDALDKIGRLTFASNNPKKVIETIMRVIRGATEALKIVPFQR